MNKAEKLLALRMIDLIIYFYLPSIRDSQHGGGQHTLNIWQKIKAEIEKVKED